MPSAPVTALPRLVRTQAELRAALAVWRHEGHRIGLVPTMGALHEGHLSLIRRAGEEADRVAVSIFVNPLQFGPKEDLSRYPRDLEGDLAKCGLAGADLVFQPEPAEIYPEGFQTHVEVERLSQGLCGASRPGHFRGVATVVTKRLCLFGAEVAVFGQKDFQQLRVIERLAQDLSIPTRIVGAPIVREPDGLAMSSRNAYLSSDERRRALSLSQGIAAARTLFQGGETRPDPLRTAVLDRLASSGVRPDYVELRDPATLEPLAAAGPDARLLVAAFVGTTRLLDNASLGEGRP